jgi:hypothetical protein
MSARQTQRRVYSGAEASENNFTKHLDSGASDAFKKPWHRLERGLRLNRLRAFSEKESAALQLSATELAALFALLAKALDKKLLNSKTTVIYDSELEAITEVKGLVMHRGSDGIMRFQLVEKKAGMTFRKRKNGVGTGTGTDSDRETAAV